MEVKRVFIREKYRGNGVAEYLMSQLESQAKKDNFYHLIIETGKSNLGAIKFYKQMRYYPIDNYPPYTGLVNSIYLKKDLEY